MYDALDKLLYHLRLKFDHHFQFISGLQHSNGVSALQTLLTLLNRLKRYPILSKSVSLSCLVRSIFYDIITIHIIWVLVC
jgi:hypothetical protein